MDKFEIGDLVECIDSTDCNSLRTGTTYTVLDATSSYLYIDADPQGGYNIRRFRHSGFKSSRITVEEKNIINSKLLDLEKRWNR